MTNPNLNLVNQQAERVTNAYSLYLTKKKVYDDIQSGISKFPIWGNNPPVTLQELQRQYDYHISNGNTSNANFVKTYLNTAIQQNDSAKNNMNIAKANYDSELKEYQKLSESLLTPAEQNQADLQLQENLNSTTENKNQISNSKKVWLIIGIIVFVLLIILLIIWIVRKSKKQKEVINE